MRSIWSGSISFGLVNIPVKLYSATEERAVSFDLLHEKDNSKIGYAKICKQEHKEVPLEEIVKGFEISEGNYVIVEEKDFEKADPKKTKSIEILHFSNAEEIEEIFYNKPYYLEPDKGSDKSFLLLRDALTKSKKVGVAKFVMKNREHLAILKPFGDVFLLNQLRFQDEIRDAEPLRAPNKEEIKTDELKIALELINHLTEPFRPERYKDTYTEELKEIIKEKAKGKVVVMADEPAATEMEDLMEALRASIKKEKVKTK